ncbi:TetR/AcrR family transcriptional regulator [Marinoscillum sp.]|uniref:TetR/AcrR family transcriptional regulator n=1 Tax=Marinoscillum sp. TaxID=2024838 RepID=UPI003BAADF14
MTDTKQDILDLAEYLIRSRGYHAFSYKDLSTPLKVKNAAIHYHFPAKKDLGVAVIRKNIEVLQDCFANWEGLPAREQLFNFIEIYSLNSRSNLICFMGALGPAYQSLPEEMRAQLTEAGLQIRNWLKWILNKGIEENAFHFNETVEEKADVIITSLLASLILNRVTGDQVLENVVSLIRQTI